jgi:hypothetical protein
MTPVRPPSVREIRVDVEVTDRHHNVEAALARVLEEEIS